MQDPATGKSGATLPASDDDVDGGTPIWDELAPDWAKVQSLLTEEVATDAPA